MKLSIIGFGRLGRLMAQNLAFDFDVGVLDINGDYEAIRALRARPLKTLEEVVQADAILPVVPISEFEGVIKSLAPLIKPKTIVIDVCSVKMKPMEAMLTHLPDFVQVIGTHPMFGPDSIGDSLLGQKIVLCPGRVDEKLYKQVKGYLIRHGLKLIETTPEEHDRQIGRSLFLTHLLGRTLMDFEAAPQEIDTLGYRRLLKILRTVNKDSWQLFNDMYKYNPYAEKAREGLMNSLAHIVDRLKS